MSMKSVLKAWIAAKRLAYSDLPLQNKSEAADLDPIAHRQIKKENFSTLQANSMAKHDSACDIIGCDKTPCFISQPDKIVSKPYKVSKKTGKKIE